MQRVRAMERTLFRIARAIVHSDADCADAIQEAVFKGWMKRGTLREPRYFETWMARILINECRSMLRRPTAMPLAEAALPAAAEEGVALHLQAALKRLPEKYRVPLLLHHLEGYPLDDVARILNLPVALLKSRLHQARRALRKILEEGEEKA